MERDLKRIRALATGWTIRVTSVSAIAARRRPISMTLQPREEFFHGVQALRLTPVGGGDIYGRAGLLAHSYMLGPNGDSNGCVSFKDYEAFLQAYQNGQVKRLAVVASLN